jgi:hypothetical protein
MQKVRVLLLLLGLCWFSGQGMFLYAQEDDQEDQEEQEEENPDYEIETDWDGYMPELYSRGDQTVTVSAGVVFPVVFFNNRERIYHNFKPAIGGAVGPLAYSYFLNAHWFVGVEIGFKFNYTLGQNVVFIIPIGAQTGWQFVIHRFEIPLRVVIGPAPQRYLNKGYVGLFIKGGGSVYFRFNPNWSFGLGADWNWYPQWPRKDGKPDPASNVDAHIISLTLSARYHF